MQHTTTELIGFSYVLHRYRREITAVCAGQALSVLLAATGIFTTVLSTRYNVNIPTSQTLLNYLLLCVYCGFLVKKKTFVDIVKSRGLRYVLLALVDVEANYFFIKAYKFTTIASVMLLDCFTIPTVTVLSIIFLRSKYMRRHYAAIALCLSGLVVLVISDWKREKDGDKSGKNPLLGDALCLCGAVLYSMSNVGEEATLRKCSKTEYLGMLGFFGSIISFVQLLIFERKELSHVKWSSGVVLCVIGYAMCLFLLYSLLPYMLSSAGATLLNLSFLTSDVIAVIFGSTYFHQAPSSFYFLAFFIIVAGLVLYNTAESTNDALHTPTPPRSDTIPCSITSDEKYAILLEEEEGMGERGRADILREGAEVEYERGGDSITPVGDP